MNPRPERNPPIITTGRAPYTLDAAALTGPAGSVCNQLNAEAKLCCFTTLCLHEGVNLLISCCMAKPIDVIQDTAWALSPKYCTNSTKKTPRLRMSPNTRAEDTKRDPTTTQPQPPSGAAICGDDCCSSCVFWGFSMIALKRQIKQIVHSKMKTDSGHVRCG